MELRDLKNIGLTQGEIKVYTALLELGECKKSALAKKSGISPSNIYDVTNRLLEKGIISRIEKNGVAHFSPANPRKLTEYINQKEVEIEKEKTVVNEMTPILLSMFNKTREKSNVEVFYGWNGLKTVFDDMIEECQKEDKNYVFGASKGFEEKQTDTFFLKYSRARETKGIITDIIFNKDILEREHRIDFFIKSKKYNVKFMQQTTPSEIMTYKNRTCIIILSKEVLAIRITSKEVAESFKQYFESMWNIAKPYKK